MAVNARQDTFLNTLGLVGQLGCVGLQLILIPVLFDKNVYGALQGVLAVGYLLATFMLAGLQSVVLISLSRGKRSSIKIFLLAQHKIIRRLVAIFVFSLVVATVSLDAALTIYVSVPIAILLFADSVMIANRRFTKLLFRRVLPDFSLVVFFLFAYSFNLSKEQVVGWLPFVVCVVFSVPALVFALTELLPMNTSISSLRTGLNVQRPAIPFLGWTVLQALMQRGSIVFVASVDLGVVVYLRYCQYVAQIGQYLSNGLLLVKLRNLLGDGKHHNSQAGNEVAVLSSYRWAAIFLWSITINAVFWFGLSQAANLVDVSVLEINASLIFLSIALTASSVGYQWSSAGVNWQGRLRTYLSGQIVTVMVFMGGLLLIAFDETIPRFSNWSFNVGTLAVLALTVGRIAGTTYYQVRRKDKGS